MSTKSFLIFFSALLLGIVCYKVVFVPTSLKMNSSPETIYAGGASPVVVRAVMTNRLGMRVPFERLTGKFVVDEGGDKINIVSTEGDEIVFRTKGAAGRLILLFYSKVIPFPVEIVLDIKGSTIAGLV